MNYQMPIFRTDRLILRPFEERDFQDLRALDSDSNVMRFLGNGKVRSVIETRKCLENHLNNYRIYGLGLYAVIDQQTGTFLGRSGLIPWQLDNNLEWEVGYTLHKAYWGRGYATEAAVFLRDWALENMDLTYLIGLINPENTKSIRIADKVGMKYWKTSALNGVDLAVFRIDLKEER